MHELRIHRIDLVGGNRTIEFAGDFAVISGSITTGKTTVVRLIRSLLGRVPGHLPPETSNAKRPDPLRREPGRFGWKMVAGEAGEPAKAPGRLRLRASIRAEVARVNNHPGGSVRRCPPGRGSAIVATSAWRSATCSRSRRISLRASSNSAC